MPSHASHHQPPDRLDALIRRSGGVVRVAELVRCGAGSAESDWPPVWRKLLPGVVFTAERTPTVRDRRRAALRYAGAGALLTGLTALRLHGMRRLPVEWEVHLLTPPRRRRTSTAYVVVQRSSRRMPAHRWKDGLPCTLPARAVVDAVRRLKGADVIHALLKQASAHPRCTVGELANELRLADGRGLRLPRHVFGEFCEGARLTARGNLRSMLERARLPPAVFEPDLPGRPVAWWPDRGVAVALDTSGWSLTADSALAVRAETHRLSSQAGLTVVRVVPEELSCRPAAVLTTVSTAVLTPVATTAWHERRPEQRKECA
ncbi:hypothetical protein [Flindersiella endophytica]